MSREYRQLVLEAKAAPPQGEGGAELEEKRGLLSAGRGVNAWRQGGGTHAAQTSLGKRLARTDKRIDSTYRGPGMGSPKASKKRGKLFGQRRRISNALSYLDARASRNARTRSLSLGDR